MEAVKGRFLTMRESLSRDLVRVGRQRQQARARAGSAAVDLRELVREAYAAGMRKSEIARLAQVTRATVDAMLRD